MFWQPLSHKLCRHQSSTVCVCVVLYALRKCVIRSHGGVFFFKLGTVTTRSLWHAASRLHRFLPHPLRCECRVNSSTRPTPTRRPPVVQISRPSTGQGSADGAGYQWGLSTRPWRGCEKRKRALREKNRYSESTESSAWVRTIRTSVTTEQTNKSRLSETKKQALSLKTWLIHL